MDKDTRDNLSFYDVHVVSASGNENLNKQSWNKDKNYINKDKRKISKKITGLQTDNPTKWEKKDFTCLWLDTSWV